MKKATAIVLLVLYMFNLFGYRIFFNYAQQQQDSRLEVLFDNDQYDEKYLVEIKIELYNPYQIDWPDYRRLDGEINVDGKLYKYVKGKVTDGNLFVLCIPNIDKMILETAKDDFFKDVNNLHNGGEPTKSPAKSAVLKNALTDFDQCWQNGFNFIVYTNLQQYTNFGKLVILHAGAHCSPEQPPEWV